MAKNPVVTFEDDQDAICFVPTLKSLQPAEPPPSSVSGFPPEESADSWLRPYDDDDQMLAEESQDTSQSQESQNSNHSQLENSHKSPSSSSSPSPKYSPNSKYYSVVQIRQEKVQNVRTISIKCDQGNCGQLFSSRVLLDAHLQSVHEINPYRCLHRGCGRSFELWKQLLGHFSSAHPNLTLWECAKCPHRYVDNSSLTQHHIRYHEAGLFACAFTGCSFEASFRRLVAQHFIEAHRRHIKCSFRDCGRVFSRGNDLTRHQAVHYNFRPYSCLEEGCGMSFRYKHNLTNHELVHRCDLPNRCKWPGCSYQSIRRSGALQHIRTQHLKQPSTVKERLMMTDDRDPRDWLEVVKEKKPARKPKIVAKPTVVVIGKPE